MNPNSGEPPDLAALSVWAPELAKTFVTLASDIALVIDEDGVIRNVAQGSNEPIAAAAFEWVGRPWIDTVSDETRNKITNLLKEVAATGIARRREVNHPLTPGINLPIAYTAIRLGEHGPVLAVGRDLRTIAAIQQRFIESQQDMERGYWQARQAEARYRLLFQVATDAVMVVDAATLNILEANQAAGQLFDTPCEQLAGRPTTFGFEHHSRGAINELLNTARSSGQPGEIRARLMGKAVATNVAATAFRADDALRLLVRVRGVDAPSSAELSHTLAKLVDGTRDGVVVTDSSGRILVANPAFLQLLQLSAEAEVKGRLLTDWLGNADGPLVTLLPQVRRDGIARNTQSWARPAHAAPARVDISATLLTEGDQECIGFTIHRSAAEETPARAGLPASLQAGLEQLAAQLGDVPLPMLLREATALAERHFTQIALQRAEGDVATAAGLLGVNPEHVLQRSAPRQPAGQGADSDAGPS